MKKAQEVSEQNGFRRFVITILIATLVGALIRVSLSPTKVERLVRAKIVESLVRENLVFASAEISLADGAVPDLAVILNKVEWRLGGHCLETAPVRARLVRVPMNFLSLFTGTVAVGSVKVDELTVDLDDLKKDCGAKAPSIVGAGVEAKNVDEKSSDALPTEIWSTDDQKRVSSLLSGVRVSRAEVFFENRMKSVILEDASAMWRGQDLDVSTSLRFPPATVFGENLPAFAINGTVKQKEMLAQVRADLSEGALEANASFTPVQIRGARELNADIGLSFSSLPLSVVTPLLSKSQIVTGAFQPKFIWLDCNAHVRGTFSRLFVENPITLSSCSVSGQVGRVSFNEATRLPNGRWKPFEVSADKLDIAKVLETFEIPGPTGVFANFGQLTGKLNFNSAEDVSLSGQIAGAVIRFAGGEGTALQPFSIESLKAALSGRKWNLDFRNFKIEGGDAALTVSADANRDTKTAALDINLNHLKLSSRVEKAVFTGPVEEISGKATASFDLEKAALVKLRAGLELRDWRGTELTAKELKIESQIESQLESQLTPAREIEVTAKSPAIEALKTGNLFRLLQPALFGWDGDVTSDGKLLILSRVAIKGRFHDDGFHWSSAGATVGRVLNLSSKGSVFRDHNINSELEARYPLASHLKWSVSGTWMRPTFANASPELGALYLKAGLPRETVTGQVPPGLLGISKSY